MNVPTVAPPLKPSVRLALAFILAAWILGALPGLSASPLRRASQARAWCVARTMATEGDVIVPSYHGEPRLKKPPLHSWIQAAAMKVAGSTAIDVAGFVSWLVGLLWVLTPYLLGRVLGRPTAGFVGSLALASSRAAAWWGASPEHDIPFGAFVGLAWIFLARALSSSGRSRDAWFAGLATGAALLVKGPFALAFVTLVAVVETWRRRADPSRGRIAWVGLLVGTVALPLAWLALVANELGSVGAVFDEMLSQATGAEGAHVKGGLAGWFYFLGVIPAYALPWAIPAIPALVYAWRLRRRGSAGGGTFPTFAMTALAVGFLTLTLVPAKQDHYMLPLLPAAFLLMGSAFEDVLLAAPSRILRLAPFVILGCGAFLAANRLYGARMVGFVPPSLADLALTLIAVQFAFLVAWPKSLRGVIVSLLAAAYLCGWAARADGVRYLATDDYRETAAAVSLPGDERLDLVGFAAGKREAFDTLVAWLDGADARYTRVTTVEEIRARIATGARFRLIVGSDEQDALEPIAHLLAPRGLYSPAKPQNPKDTVLLFVSRPP